MSHRLSTSHIISAMAQHVARRVTRRVVRDLMRMRGMLFQTDSELESAWDEICVQVQYQESLYWDAYDETVRHLVSHHLGALPQHEREALWLQTDAGIDWIIEEPEHGGPDPVREDETVAYLVQAYVYPEAGGWSNARIRSFLDRAQRSD